jgi:hypothetical protein
MTRTASASRPWPTPGRTARRTRHGAFASPFVLGVAAVLVAFSGTTVSTAASGPGIGIKVGVQTIDDPVYPGKLTRARLDLEVASPLLWDEHVDFAVSFGGSYVGTYTETYTDTVDGTYIDDLYTDRLSLFDIRLAARLYPLGASSPVRPYLGAGIGYFWFRDNWENEYSDTFEDPYHPGDYDTVYDHAEGQETLANAPFPFFLAGLTLPLGSNAEIMFEFQYDLDKKDRGYDLSGPIYSFGARFRF